MVDLFTCKNEEDPIKNVNAGAVTTLSISFEDAQGELIPKIGDGILTKLKLIQSLIASLIVCKNEEDPFKIESTRVVTTFLPL